VAATAALCLGIVWMLRNRLLRESPHMAATRPLVDRWPASDVA
jgi:hypothetical protein